MSTATLERPATVNGAGPSTSRLSEEVRREEQSLRDRIMSAPRAVRDYLRNIIHWARLDKAVTTAEALWLRVKPYFQRFFGPLRAIGPWFLAGALLTSRGGRRLLRGALGFTYQVVSAPFRWIGKGASWLMHKVGLGKAADRIEAGYDQATSWVAVRFDLAMDWLDAREHYDAMRGLRVASQSGVWTKLIRRYVPDRFKTVLTIGVNLLMPIFGVGSVTSAKATTTESKLSLVKDYSERAEQEIRGKGKKAKPAAKDEQAPAASDANDAGGVEVIEKLSAIVVGTGRLARLQRVTRSDGSVFYRYGGKEYAEGELPSHIRLADQVADANPEPPAPNRETRRAQEQQQKRDKKAEAKVEADAAATQSA